MNEKLREAITKIVFGSDAYVYEKLVLMTRFVETTILPALAGVQPLPSEIIVYLNPLLLYELPVDDIVTVLKHEYLHILNAHVWCPLPDPEKDNIAADIEINQPPFLNVSPNLAKIIFTYNKLELLPSKTREWYYEQIQRVTKLNDDLRCKFGVNSPNKNKVGGASNTGTDDTDTNSADNDSEEQKNKQSKSKGESEGQVQDDDSSEEEMTEDGSEEEMIEDGSEEEMIGDDSVEEIIVVQTKDNKRAKGKLADDHDYWKDSAVQASKEIYRRVVQEIIEEAEKHKSDTAGKLVEEIKAKWKREGLLDKILKRIIAKTYRGSLLRKQTYTRSNRRNPLLAGEKSSYGPVIVLALDTSGSMSTKEIEEIVSVYRWVAKKMETEMIQCDAEIHEVTKDLRKTTIQIKGRGGTNFEPVFEYIKNKYKDKIDLLIFGTDLEGTFPQQAPPYKVVWLATSDHKAPFGEVIRLRHEETEEEEEE